MKEIKQFQTESRELLNLVINSIYSNKDVFLREIISNASDALDKYKYLALTDKKYPSREYEIWIELDKENKTLTITDNGIGMDKDELVDDLGTIAKSGSKEFISKLKSAKDQKETINIIGQFGVGFYSAYMVAKNIEVYTKKENGKGYKFESDGQESYSIEEDKSITDTGTKIVIHLKDDSEEFEYSQYLDEYVIEELIKKYSNYIRYPIKMNVTSKEPKKDADGKVIENEYNEVVETKTLNSMVPLWKKNRSEVKDEDLNAFYKEQFSDYEDPLSSMFLKVDGLICYNALVYIPSHIPADLYSDSYEKGLDLYAKSVFIQKNCKTLIPDYLKFVKGLVDSDDLSLNVSREILQNDARLNKIRDSIEKKVLSTLKDLMEKDEEKYNKFFENYGTFLKFGIYSTYGGKKEDLQDLLIYNNLNSDKMITLKSYVERMDKDQKYIYYACGKTLESIRLLPQLESYKKKGIDVLLLKDNIDEFALMMMRDYDGKQFKNISSETSEELTPDEKSKIDTLVSENKEILDNIKEALKDEVSEVTFTNKLVDAPVCLSSKDGVSMNMEEVMDQSPETSGKIKSRKVLEINPESKLFEMLKTLKDDKENIDTCAKILYSEALLLQGYDVKDKTEFVKNINELMIKLGQK
ncbi:MAG TPA: molecular chaperone HtpG [Firmicutes bacterium]|nr:molecular chaperone HtpG [Bacillota bacterium]